MLPALWRFLLVVTNVIVAWMRKPLVVANWKTYVETQKDARALLRAARRAARSWSGVDVWVAPQATLVSAVVDKLKRSDISVGSQAVSPFLGGQHTGEVSAASLADAGVQFVIIGHSERRYPALGAGENDEEIRAQVARASEAALAVVLCVGERERAAGPESDAHFAVVEHQLTSALKDNVPDTLLVAYEPVWAIGKSAVDAIQPEQLEEMVIFIRKTLAQILGAQGGLASGRERSAALRVPILYGGSVEAENVAGLLMRGDIAGFLVGHASVSAHSFVEILKSVRHAKH